jgi:hypothetical protein
LVADTAFPGQLSGALNIGDGQADRRRSCGHGAEAAVFQQQDLRSSLVAGPTTPLPRPQSGIPAHRSQ